MLNRIIETKKEEVSTLSLPEQAEVEKRSFYEALSTGEDPISLIAEVKKASPSKGVIREDFRPVEIAAIYNEAGASAISVLTDQTYFQGKREDLTAVKQHVKVPILRKDFIIDELQVEESARIGADAILLIGEVLEPQKLYELYQKATELGLDALVEVHAAETLERILDVFQPKIIGVNNRDLTTFKTTLEQTEKIARFIPEGSLVVSESGLFSYEDVKRVKQAGAKAILVGEALMRENNATKQIHNMLGRVHHESNRS
ncbi:indole-3-glycerol phosphate synthase TrpC [Pontibacillus sp. ALD_SL1]|uniref:indole-3-glycerol phosphate synthase TrpC n=1 Tax=Pontibacillus sp. ALD_SL1 TaxID=2777185 RepID=UPI001A9655FF|nr:indole-3-glycerol phosphate synthase TrpC [Pontibacillus sp. ALD_SL1]QST00508.1 indole-3-glycerol phosphate synthase TrpC [Pontibacillus sp. ALD_SL1]